MVHEEMKPDHRPTSSFAYFQRRAYRVITVPDRTV